MKILLAFTFLIFYLIPCHGVNENVTLPAHPRLLVTQNDIARLRSRMIHPDFSAVKRAFDKQKDYPSDGLVPNGKPNEAIRQKMEALALEYLLDNPGKTESGKMAVSIAKNYLSSITYTQGYAANTQAYEAVLGAALVYDWCYQLLGSSDKTQLTKDMNRVCCLAEYCPESKSPGQYLSGHYGESAPTVFLAMGIATFDENPALFNRMFDEQVNQFAPSRNPMYKAGTHHQGSQYLHVRYTNEILQAFMLDKLGLNPYDKNISSLTYRDMYTTIPQGKDLDQMTEGDCHNDVGMGFYTFIPISAQMSGDPFLQSYARQNLRKLTNQSARLFIYYNPEINSKPVNDLSLSRFFPSPSGIMMARTKWDIDIKDFNSKAMVVLMNMREYSSKNHVHLDDGNFSIYYKGHLALDAGIYQGKDPDNEWGKPNYINYYARTVAHNSILILDPNEPCPFEGWDKKTQARDGGQFSFSNHAWDNSREMFAAGKSAQVMAEDIAKGTQPDYSYLKGDMTRAYNVPSNVAKYPAKADTVRRSFVFLNLKSENIPGALIVLDKVVSTNASFKKSWLLHSQNQPNIQNGVVTFENTRDGRNGKLQDNVLLPEFGNQNIVKIGGPGKEYWVDGKNWGSVTQEDAGNWRIELSPKREAKSDNFLNVIQVMDAKPSPAAFAIDKAFASKGNYVALSISDRIVAEQLSLDKNDRDIEFAIGDKSKEYKVLVTDLKPGNWMVSTTSGKSIVSVNDSTGTTNFTARGGKFTLKHMVSSASGAMSQGKIQRIQISNTQSYTRENEVISIDRNLLKQNNPLLYPIVTSKNQLLASQLTLDEKGDKWDKLLVEVNLKANQKDTLQLEWVTKDKLPAQKKATNIRFSLKSKTTEPTAEIEKLMRLRGYDQDPSNPVYQMEGPGIENDKVAFRVFFDKRNGKDLYGKITPDMVLDRVGLTGTWHDLQDWGMDILHTYGSLGAGGAAVKENNTVYPLADADSTFFNQVEEGPLKATLNLCFTNWDAGTVKCNGSERVSMQKGDFYFKDEVTIPLRKNQQFVTGTPNFDVDSLVYTVHNKKFSSISTFGKQAEGTTTLLGLAVMFPTDLYAGSGKAGKQDKVANSFYVTLHPTKNNVQSFYYFACWDSTDKRFHTQKGFHDYLRETADKLANPIQIKVINF